MGLLNLISDNFSLINLRNMMKLGEIYNLVVAAENSKVVFPPAD